MFPLLTPNQVDLKSKVEYFAQLYSLNDSFEDEGEIRRECQVLDSSSILSPLSSPLLYPLNRAAITFQGASGIRRTISDPTSTLSLVEESAPLPRKESLLHPDISTSRDLEASFTEADPTTEAGQSGRLHAEHRTISNPAVGDLVLLNSTGVATMLGKRKRKATSVVLKPESEQIFKGQTFYYIPPNDIAPLRRQRIVKAREYGAIWAKEWTSDITHIIVDKPLTYADVMKFLNQSSKVDSLPEQIVMVNEDYPIGCITWRCLLNPVRAHYTIEGFPKAAEDQAISSSQKSNSSLDLKPPQSKRGKWDYVPPKQTPPRSEQSTQLSRTRDHTEQEELGFSPGVWLTPANNQGGPLHVGSQQVGSELYKGDARSATEGYDGPRDELDEMIDIAQRTKHLPLDDDDVDAERPSSSDSLEETDDSGSDREEARVRLAALRRKGAHKGGFNQDSFSCMRGGTGVTLKDNPNARTIEVLQEMADHYTRMNDVWRSRAYPKAISTLRRQTTKITSYEEAIVLQFVGPRLARKIEEIALTDRLARLESAKADHTDHILQRFMKIYQVGLSQAWRWMLQGHKTLQDLKGNVDLTINQRIGLEHYEEFLTRIPRDEVTALGRIVKERAVIIDSKIEIIVGGSYRRGASNSGDIDLVVTKAGTSSTTQLMPFLSILVDDLTNSGFLVAALAVPHDESGSKWHGCCVLPGSEKPLWRRIDFLLVPETEIGAALIYFTGDDFFNRSMRLLASKKGMRLNQNGLWKDVIRGPNGSRMTQGTLVEGADEKKIFKELGVPWRPPEQRICR